MTGTLEMAKGPAPTSWVNVRMLSMKTSTVEGTAAVPESVGSGMVMRSGRSEKSLCTCTPPILTGRVQIRPPVIGVPRPIGEEALAIGIAVGRIEPEYLRPPVAVGAEIGRLTEGAVRRKDPSVEHQRGCVGEPPGGPGEIVGGEESVVVQHRAPRARRACRHAGRGCQRRISAGCAARRRWL